ncbi:MAG: Rieske (2Fe-2S) protein [Caldisericia bacterium]
MKPFGKIGLEVPPAPVAVNKLASVMEPVGDSFVPVPAKIDELKSMVGYSFEIITEDRSIPYKPIKIREPGILIKDSNGTLMAWDAKCTHLGCVVRWNTESKTWHCRCHDGFFDPTMTKVLGGPPPSPLRPWTALVDDDGGIIIDKKTFRKRLA